MKASAFDNHLFCGILVVKSDPLCLQCGKCEYQEVWLMGSHLGERLYHTPSVDQLLPTQLYYKNKPLLDVSTYG